MSTTWSECETMDLVTMCTDSEDSDDGETVESTRKFITIYDPQARTLPTTTSVRMDSQEKSTLMEEPDTFSDCTLFDIDY